MKVLSWHDPIDLVVSKATQMKKNKKKFEKKIMKLKGKKKVGLCFAIYINCTCGMYIKDKINMKKN
jgi:hypothetical protein